jgi:hypothetical protein
VEAFTEITSYLAYIGGMGAFGYGAGFIIAHIWVRIEDRSKTDE